MKLFVFLTLTLDWLAGCGGLETETFRHPVVGPDIHPFAAGTFSEFSVVGAASAVDALADPATTNYITTLGNGAQATFIMADADLGHPAPSPAVTMICIRAHVQRVGFLGTTAGGQLGLAHRGRVAGTALVLHGGLAGIRPELLAAAGRRPGRGLAGAGDLRQSAISVRTEPAQDAGARPAGGRALLVVRVLKPGTT